MAQALISHVVADYEKWRPIFDANMHRLADVGVTVIAVLRDADNPFSVWVFLDSDRVVGEAFLHNSEIETWMQKAGVVDSVNVYWVD